MPSVHVITRTTKAGERRYFVRFRAGGRESPLRHAGSFRTLKDARTRMQWVSGELAAGRLPDLDALNRPPAPFIPLADWAAQWQSARIDVSAATRNVDRKSLAHVLGAFGDRDPKSLTSQEIAEWIASLADKYTRGTCSKILGALQRVLEFADVDPNPARDRRVRLPREERREIEPPTAAEMTALISYAAPRYRLPLTVLEATGMRVSELEALTWGDLDATGQRWRVARQNSKTGRARWVNVPTDVFEAVSGLVPQEDRDLSARVFVGLAQASLRTDMARACRAAGIPLYSPHDLRHRRISLWHMQGIPLKQVGEWVGQRNLSVTADIYTHVLTDGEIDRGL